MLTVEIVHTEGYFWQRVAEYLRGFGGPVTATQLPHQLPMIIDYPREFLPEHVGAAAVSIAINIHQDLLVELPSLMAEKGGQVLIAPREDPNWIRPGLVTQVGTACEKLNLESAFPEPFCALVASTPILQQFCEQYRVGRSKFELVIANNTVIEAHYVRGAPCGLTQGTVPQLVGVEAGEPLIEKVKMLHHSRPCLASMAMVPGMDDTLMHKSLFLFEDSAQEALERAAGKR